VVCVILLDSANCCVREGCLFPDAAIGLMWNTGCGGLEPP